MGCHREHACGKKNLSPPYPFLNRTHSAMGSECQGKAESSCIPMDAQGVTSERAEHGEPSV